MKFGKVDIFINLYSSVSIPLKMCFILKISVVPALILLLASVRFSNLSFCPCSAGNLRHLIVEACIARNLLDTSAYFWPGYVNGHINQMPNTVPAQVPGWSSFMKGAPLTPLMVNALVSSPASRYNKIIMLKVDVDDHTLYVFAIEI